MDALKMGHKVIKHGSLEDMERMRRVLAAIEEYQRQHKGSPSVRELMARLGTSYSVTQHTLEKLAASGFITHRHKKSAQRSISVIRLDEPPPKIGRRDNG